jgi:hypothetical protein
VYTSEHSIVIRKPIDVVFKNTTCLKGCIHWFAGMEATEQIDLGPLQVGSQYRHTYGILGFKAEVRPVVTVYNPPTEFAFEDKQLSLAPHSTRYTFTEVPEGTRVNVVMQIDPRDNLIGEFATPIVLKRLQSQIDYSLNTLKELLEAGQTVHAK